MSKLYRYLAIPSPLTTSKKDEAYMTFVYEPPEDCEVYSSKVDVDKETKTM